MPTSRKPHSRKPIRVPRKPVKVTRFQPPPNSYTEEEEEAFAREDWSKLRENYKRRREEFCRQYIIDYNGAAAIRRMGYSDNQPWVLASKWLDQPYTQWYLAKLIADLDDKSIVTRQEILLGLKKEANYFGRDGGSAARVSAWSKLG